MAVIDDRDELAALAAANPVDEAKLPLGRSPQAQARLEAILQAAPLPSASSASGAAEESGALGSWQARRWVLVGALAAALAVAVATPAFGLHRVVVSWFEAETAPKQVQLSFARLGIGAPAGMDPGIIVGSARKVTEVSVGGRTRVLWVAPTRGGGFCELWTNLFSGCTRDRVPPRRLERGRDFHTFELGVSQSQNARGIVTMLAGRLLDPATERLELRYADGGAVEIRVVWVSPPIDAGFYLYDIPEQRERVGHQATALVARDAEGEVIAHQTFPLPPAMEVEHPARLPDGELVSLPAKALVEQARKLIDFRADNGQQVTLWVMPTSEGGMCFVSNRWGGCPPVGYRLEVPMAAGLLGGTPVLFFAQTRDEVAAVELRFQDGAVETVEPVQGFVLHEIGSAHYDRGHRLIMSIARGADGSILYRYPFPLEPNAPSVYPCENDEQVDIGFGVMACP